MGKEVDRININKDEYPSQFNNILCQAKLTFPSGDNIQKLSADNVDTIEIIFRRK